MNRFAVIADDLTGANENGLQFLRKGLSAETLIYQKGVFKKDLRAAEKFKGILIVDSGTRQKGAVEAGRVTEEIAARLFSAGTERIYLKFDSTLRGYPGAVINSVLARRPKDYAAVCMAYPEAGRITKNGEQYVWGKRVTETAFAKDPLNPVRSSGIRKVLGEGTKLCSGIITLSKIRKGIAAVLCEKDKLLKCGARILVFDCANDRDVRTVARSILDCRIICGASALSKELAGKEGRKKAAARRKKTRVVGIIGSQNPVTTEQLEYLRSHERIKCVFVDGEDVSADFRRKETKYSASSMKKTDISGNFVVVLRSGKRTDGYIKSLTRAKGAAAAAELIGRGLASIAEQFGAKSQKDAFFFTGGATAEGASLEYSMRGFILEGEVAPGIPLLRTRPGKTWVVTKSGGFGKKDALRKIVKLLEGKNSLKYRAGGKTNDYKKGSRACGETRPAGILGSREGNADKTAW